MVVDGNDVTNAKPDPEVFLMAAKQTLPRKFDRV
jgi:beta-phosphoglucomutase-like phosphatase (HAD superfamily)